MDIGAPMAAMYLLGNPDHYTDHKFCTFYWRSYVFEARRPWLNNAEDQKNDKVTIVNKQGILMGVTPVHDYTLRPVEYDNMSLYGWICLYNKKKRPRPDKNAKSKIPPVYTISQTSDLHNSSKNNNDSDTDMSDFLVGGGCNNDVDMAYSSENDNSGVDNYEMENNLDSFMNNNLWVPNSSQTIYDLNDSEETMNVNVIFGRQYTY